MAFHSPERKAEQLFVSWIGAISGVTIRTRFSGIVKSLPLVDIICEECDPVKTNEEGFVLVWGCNLKFRVRTRYEKDDTQEGQYHDDLCAKIADIMQDSSLIASLNEYGPTVNATANMWQMGPRRSMVEDKEYVTEMEGRLWLVPYNVAA